MTPPIIYVYAQCDTCRRALKWLRAEQIGFIEKPIRETPPSEDELRAMLAAQGGNLRKLFNTSGRDYRALGLGEKFASMTADEAVRLLASNGNLIKRPFLIAPGGVGLVGFNEQVWREAFHHPGKVA